MGFFSRFTSKPLPSRYQIFILEQGMTITEILKNENEGLEAVKLHGHGLEYLMKGNPAKAINLIYEAHQKYENISIKNCTPHLLKAKGDCILDAIIISNLYEKKYDLNEFKIDEIGAFVYLWLSFELSNTTLRSSLVSLSELLLFFVEGNMILTAGFVQTMPPMHFPEFFSLVCQYWRNVWASTALRSLGSNEIRLYKKADVDLSKKQRLQRSHYKSEIKNSFKRIYEIAADANIKYNFKMQNLENNEEGHKRIIKAIMNPISKNDNVSYLELFDILIRNLKKSSAGKRITDLFKNIPITMENAFKNENHYALFTLIYTDMHNKENKKTEKDVSIELYHYAKKYYENSKYHTAMLIIEEALVFDNGNEKAKELREINGKAIMEKELGINLGSDIIDYDPYFDDDELPDLPF